MCFWVQFIGLSTVLTRLTQEPKGVHNDSSIPEQTLRYLPDRVYHVSIYTRWVISSLRFTGGWFIFDAGCWHLLQGAGAYRAFFKPCSKRYPNIWLGQICPCTHGTIPPRNYTRKTRTSLVVAIGSHNAHSWDLNDHRGPVEVFEHQGRGIIFFVTIVIRFKILFIIIHWQTYPKSGKKNVKFFSL